MLVDPEGDLFVAKSSSGACGIKIQPVMYTPDELNWFIDLLRAPGAPDADLGGEVPRRHHVRVKPNQ